MVVPKCHTIWYSWKKCGLSSITAEAEDTTYINSLGRKEHTHTCMNTLAHRAMHYPVDNHWRILNLKTHIGSLGTPCLSNPGSLRKKPRMRG